MHLAYTKKIRLFIQRTDVSAYQINGSALATFGMVIVVFSVNDKNRKVRFFEKNFLLANVSLDVVFRISFLILNNTDFRFLEE